MRDPSDTGVRFPPAPLLPFQGVAQLAERFVRGEEAAGSSPVTLTFLLKRKHEARGRK